MQPVEEVDGPHRRELGHDVLDRTLDLAAKGPRLDDDSADKRRAPLREERSPAAAASIIIIPGAASAAGAPTARRGEVAIPPLRVDRRRAAHGEIAGREAPARRR